MSISDLVAGDDAAFEAFAEAFFDGRHEVSGDGAAHDGIDSEEVFASS